MLADRRQILWHRLRVNHLAARLPAGSLETAAFAGLQDSAPRAALTALYSRVEATGPGDWEDVSLVQTWAPRGAVFVVARSDLAVFALGIMPRDPELRRALQQLAARARDSVTEVGVKRREADRLDGISLPGYMRRWPSWRLAHALAGVQIRWDAARTHLVPRPELEMDEEAARRELARRFLRSLGPAGPARFTRWAAVGKADAVATFDAIADELVSVEWPGGSGFILAEDADELARAEPVAAVRFVAFGGDPVLQPGEDVVAADRSARRAAMPPWAATGLVLIDGEPVAAWGRSHGRITILARAAPARERRPEIEAEALGMPLPGGAPQIVWRELR
ncbi:MAG TPA: crosslink repair DNA glycosylase YcaQ family protein [Solirubrobacteraceae bacterium]|nr:crosslink repair DNA glycosylase YcaQ family protein [Solirubrobacteraceae bacterium]